MPVIYAIFVLELKIVKWKSATALAPGVPGGAAGRNDDRAEEGRR